MPNSADVQVRAQISRFLLGELSLADLQRWFARVAWRLGQGESGANPLAHGVELRLAEFTSGHWTVPELRERFAELLTVHSPPTIAAFDVASNDWSGHSAYHVYPLEPIDTHAQPA
jgi:hypothetical protein